MYTLKGRVLILQFSVGFAELGHKNGFLVRKALHWNRISGLGIIC